MPGTVTFLGAGATKACGGLITNEILPAILANPPAVDPAGRLPKLSQFLQEQFHVLPGSTPESYPGLPMLMSLLDTALERRQDFHPDWNSNSILEIREAIELGIFEVLEEKLYKAQTNNHWDLINRIYPAPSQPCVVSTNYDLIMDTAMMFLSESRTPEGGLPVYHCDIASDFYRNEPAHFGVLLKLHGSLNWLYCSTCGRLEIGASESRKYLKVLQRLVGELSLEQSYRTESSQCPTCRSKLRPLLVAPTHLKNYRNPHLAQVWHEAEHVMREASRVVFVGYSLPEDDVEVIYLLKRSLGHLQAQQITVVEYDQTNPPVQAHPVGRRYRTLFGDGIDWHPEGLNAWLPKAAAAGA